MSSCFVQLDNYQGQYYAGALIEGRIICVFRTPKSIRGIKIKLQGQEHNKWTHTRSYYDNVQKAHRTVTVYYTGHNVFLRAESTLHGNGEIGAGRFEFPFTFQLPNNIPSTYQGSYGGIFFTVKAKIDRHYKVNFKHALQITVASPVDFNLIRGQLQLEPVAYSVENALCCCCCSKGLATMDVHLEKEAFVVGEVANVRVDITNMSNENVESLSVKLKMKIISRVTHPNNDIKVDSVLLAASSETGVGAHGQRTYNIGLLVPQSTEVPNFNLCQLFSQIVKLKVRAAFSGCHSDMKASTPITLGHIPIHAPPQNPEHYPPNMYPPDTYPPSYSEVSHPMDFSLAQGAVAGPSAPPTEGGASAPSQKEVDLNKLSTEESDDPWSTEIDLPSYKEAMGDPTKQ